MQLSHELVEVLTRLDCFTHLLRTLLSKSLVLRQLDMVLKKGQMHMPHLFVREVWAYCMAIEPT